MMAASNGVYIDATELTDAIKRIGTVPDKLLRKGIRRGFASLSKEIYEKEKTALKQVKEGTAKVNEKSGKAGGKRKKSTGALYKSIGKKITVNLYKGKAYFIVGPRKNRPGKPSRYAHLIENGVKAHTIKVTKGRNAGKTFNHPGHGKQEWLKPSFKGVQDKALRVVVDEIERTFEETL